MCCNSWLQRVGLPTQVTELTDPFMNRTCAGPTGQSNPISRCISIKDIAQNALLLMGLHVSQVACKGRFPHKGHSRHPQSLPSALTSPSDPRRPIQEQQALGLLPLKQQRARETLATHGRSSRSSWVWPLLPPLEPSECRLPWRGDVVSGESGGFTCFRTRRRQGLVLGTGWKPCEPRAWVTPTEEQ